MKARILIIWILLFQSLSLVAQIAAEINRINSDSLLKILPELEGTERIDVLNQIAFDLSRDNPDSSKAISLRTKQISENIPYLKGIADAHLSLGVTYLFLDSLKISVTHFLNALQLYENIDTCFGMGLVYSNLMLINHMTGRYEKSKAYARKVSRIYNALQLHNYKIIPLRSLGFTCTLNMEFDSAEYYFEQCLAIIEKYNLLHLKPTIYLNMGFNLSWQNVMLDSIINNRQDMINLYLKAIELSENFQDSIILGVSLDNLAYEYSTMGTVEGKRKWRETALRLIDYGESKKIWPQTLTQTYLRLGEYEYNEGNITKAILLTEKAIRRGKARMDEWTLHDFQDPFTRAHCRHWLKHILRWCYINLNTYYKESGDYKKALEYYILREETVKEMAQQENKDLVAVLETDYENEKNEKQIALLERDKEINALKVSQSRYYIFGLTAFLVLVLLFGVFFIRMRKIRAEQKALMREQQLQHDLQFKELESSKLKEVDKMKSRFFANISHEFRTPLTLILGLLDGLKEFINKPGAGQDLNIIRRNAVRLQNLINQLLDLSKLESGKMKLQARETDVVKLSKSYYQSFESLAKQKGIKLTFYSTDENIQVFIDQDKYEKILYNLISNAMKFTDRSGEVKLSISQSEDESHILILLSDTGRGIVPDNLEFIFNRFWQSEDERNPQQGTGIGLALVLELVELHHGEIEVESQAGQGTTFIISIPLGKEHLKEEEIAQGIEHRSHGSEIRDAASGILHPPSSIQSPVTSHQSPVTDTELPLLLVIEDNEDMRYYIRSQISDEYSIIDAADGESGLEKALETIPDLIISDVMMPKMDGMELSRKLKTDERTSHIPVILLTAKASMEDRLEGLETGADDFLTKPFDHQELKVRVNNLIQQRKKLQEKFNRNAVQIGLSKVLKLPESGINSTDQKFLQRAVETVMANIHNEDFGAENFRNELAMSTTQLFRKLKSLVGQSATGFIRTIRLNRAAELLKERSGNITEIAYEVGFNNLSYFSKCFEEQFGVLPSKFVSDL